MITTPIILNKGEEIMTMYEFMSDSPYLTFFLAVLAVSLVGFIINRPLRHMNIRKHGWPPVHCDADGDAVESDEE